MNKIKAFIKLLWLIHLVFQGALYNIIWNNYEITQVYYEYKIIRKPKKERHLDGIAFLNKCFKKPFII